MKEIKVFDHLTDDSRNIRTIVFVNEQGFKEEFDTIDNNCTHFIYYLNNKAVGTARIYYSNEHQSLSIGRFAILKEYRKQGIGKELLTYIEEYIVKKQGHIKIGLSSQERAVQFYSRCGYNIKGDMYLDENYPHYWMEKNL